MQDDFNEKRVYKKAVQDPWGRRRQRWIRKVFRKVHRFVARVPHVVHKVRKFLRTSLETLNKLKAAARKCCDHEICKRKVCSLAG